MTDDGPDRDSAGDRVEERAQLLPGTRLEPGDSVPGGTWIRMVAHPDGSHHTEVSEPPRQTDAAGMENYEDPLEALERVRALLNQPYPYIHQADLRKALDG